MINTNNASELRELPIETMTRYQVVSELRAYTRMEFFDGILSWPTQYLKGLLTFYRESNKDFGRHEAIPKIGIDILTSMVRFPSEELPPHDRRERW